MYDIIVQFSGKEHSGKTSLLALIAELLKEHGVIVTIQKADPQIEEKLLDREGSLERARQSSVLFTEYQTKI